MNGQEEEVVVIDGKSPFQTLGRTRLFAGGQTTPVMNPKKILNPGLGRIHPVLPLGGQ